MEFKKSVSIIFRVSFGYLSRPSTTVLAIMTTEMNELNHFEVDKSRHF